MFEFALRQQLKKGLVPLNDAIAFEQHLKNTVRKLKTIYKGKIILVTIGCINEYQLFELNAKRLKCNSIIRQVAKEETVALADCGREIDSKLDTLTQEDHFLRSFWAVTITDRIVSYVNAGPDFLSNRRKLNLTIDGVHLNSRGAKIFAECIADAIKNIPATTNSTRAED